MAIQDRSSICRSITIGTRKSQLALVQTEFVKAELAKFYPACTFNIVKMCTTGDKILDVALNKIGEKSLFTKELEIALANKSVDFVVHSLKDLPTTLPEGMALAAIMEREDPHDAFVLSKKCPGLTLETLPHGSVIGTSSVRRISQLKSKFPHLEFQDVRGNLNTRLAKLDAKEGPYSALILAVAGLKRLGMGERISQILPEDISLHAVSQGALGIECREGDKEILDFLSCLNHLETRQRCTAERAMMRSLEGGCSVPIGVATSIVGKCLKLRGAVVSLCGTKYITFEGKAEIVSDKSFEEAEKLGQKVAEELVSLGARDILNSIKCGSEAPKLPFGN
ncbi:hypothetical protein DSO57_1004763 [Entomophthora muscae]|uniref:Uncharacterized protein n=1 Tax=Entomophthora muscae TaxID=34485 RepID=A0ACC2UHS1_9FUNG|nr:hypothetical protein DSO57_1004763 [Entomophthora muscae]